MILEQLDGEIKGGHEKAGQSQHPFFSVVVPLYNKRPYIRRAVDSVLGQTRSDFELLVVDDGSTDGSAEALVDVEDARLRIIRQRNRGVGAARNTGMLAAKGQWIAFLDADDAWFPGHLDELARLADQFPEAGLVSTICIDAVGAKLPPAPEPGKPERRRRIDYFLEASGRIGILNSTSAAVRRYIVSEVGGFSDKQAGEDLEYWARLALRYPVALSDRVTCVYFRDTAGVMQSLVHAPQAQPPPTSRLRDVSPSIAMLCDQSERDPALWKDASIRAYVNGRLRNAVRGALFRYDVVQAKALATLFLRPLDLPTTIVASVLSLPSAVIAGLLRLYRGFRTFGA